MTLWVPQKGLLRQDHNTGASGTTAVGAACITGGAAATKGSTVTLFSSLPFDVYRIRIVASSYSLAGSAAPGCLDILAGAATEDVIIPDLLMGYCGGNTAAVLCGPKSWEFPLYIPAGQRLSARVAGLLLTTTMRVCAFIEGGDGGPKWRAGGKVTTYGITTVPNGTTITPGASGAAGSFVQLTASTSEAHFALVPSFQPSNVTVLTEKYHQLTIGLGSATEDEIANYWYSTQGSEQMTGPWNAWPTFMDIPQGTRLAMRVSCSGTVDAGGWDCAIHAVS